MNLGSTWYNLQFNRNRLLPQAADTPVTPMAQPPETPQGEPAIVNINPAGGKDKKSSEPLFGPSIGSVSAGPAWTLSGEKKVVTDELTQDIITSWIEKSKEPSHPTTTLQALVNLKRPTLRLSPLSAVHDDSGGTNTVDQHHHGLEFEYDCDAPKCGIYVNVHLPKTHPDAPAASSHSSSLCKLQVFETVIEGGFGNRLTLDEGALLELGRFENSQANAQQAERSQTNAGEPSSEAPAPGNLPTSPSTLDLSATANNNANTNANTSSSNHARRRFTQFHFRRRHNRSVAGPALTVVDAEPAAANEGKAKDGKEDSEDGVKVTIRLAALDEQGTELSSPNEQITYLHIVRFGQKVEGGDGPEEDTRPWVVRVVKREATIGPHTFHLHEIFGLTSTSSHEHAPTTPIPTAAHTYPPDESQGVAGIGAADDDDDPQSECLLCLSSPREVVLLPCRHLVACKECALNMVEFGAGGNITQSEVPVPGTATPGGGGEDGAANNGATTPATPAPPTTNPRRKRKAKGWFCPVCRQPYTSMLRLTTSAPPPAESKEGDGSGSEDESPASPGGITPSGTGQTSEVRGGLLGAAFRPGFFRGLSMSRSANLSSQPPDVENQNVAVRS
ncbi:unnamed protein product [Cyclocybe aegerita]|uniref:RING-type domain-containing protein n=1 Tax=Cyclocybe aegerita TaxID=1973307 RepID=A0A8S0XS16_CYCAE|nr:unnamed protein product [Cyclocybe aegerita]